MVSIQTLILFQMHWYCGMDAVGGETETASQRWPQASDASGEAVMFEWHSRVDSDVLVLQSFKQAHLPRAEEQRHLPQMTCQHRRFIRSDSHQCTHSQSQWHCATITSVSPCLKIGHRGIQKGEIILIWQKRTTDSLKLVQKKLIRVLPPWPHW